MAGVNCGKLDLTKLPQDEIITINNQTWLNADVDEKIYILNNKPHVVIKFSDTCVATVCDDQNALNKPLANLAGVREANDENPPSEGCDTESLNCSQDKARSLSESINNNNTNVQAAQRAVDANSINIYSWYGAAVKPASAVIPMRSNIKTYGPFASSNFGNSCGGTQVEVNTDLAPWVFGSLAAMNAAGSSIVESTAIGLVKAETGNITLPGMPSASFSTIGVALNGTGPTLSSINFSYGANGISTSYEFRTYTPKFGGLNRHFLDRIKSISKNRTEQIRFLRNNQITQNKIGRKLRNINNPPRNNNQPGGTLQRVMVGEIYNWESVNDKYTQCTIVGLDTLRKSVGEMSYDYEKKAYISLDALYGPISKNGDGGLPRYANYETNCHKASPQQPQPPFAIDDNPGSEGSNPFDSGLDQYNLEITQHYVDPLTNPFDENGHHHEGSGIGHVIDLVGREQTIPQEGMITNFYNLDDENRYSEDYRFLGMRGPILLHSWGYDTEGKPIPNASDVEEDTKNGSFTDQSLRDAFMKDWLGKPATWPVAPIDFRFDRKRGLWVSPPGYKVVVAILDEKLDAYGLAKASLINEDKENGITMGPDLYDKEGKKVKATEEKDSEAKIKVVDRIGKSYNAGTKLYCYYDTFQCEYIVLDAAQALSIRFRLIDICENTPVQPDYGDNWTKYAGYGDKFPNNHIRGIRIDCEGNPVNNKGEAVTHEDILDEEKHKDIFINLFDTCGKFGSAYAYFNSNGGLEAFNKWKTEAATGFALLCDPKSENSCSLGESETQCSSIDPDYDSYDIIFLDGYARFVECELKQKLYVTTQEAESEYPDDDYKQIDPEGNAAAEIKEFYGDPGNGIEPVFYKNNNGGLKLVDFRVFDPFKGYPKANNPFANLDYGDKVLAVFDENRKKYIIYNALKAEDKIIKFALVDNKDIGDRISRAVLVDIEGYPIDDSGVRLNEDNFEDNFITVFDSFAIHGYTEPVPKYHNFGTTGFGPALGSDDFNNHMNGIQVFSGDQNPPTLPGGDTTSAWKTGPFIGFAIRRKMPNDVSSDLSEYEFGHEIFFLESFAQIIQGKVASTKALIDNAYYLGVVDPNGFVNGRIPFVRDNIPEDKTGKANVRVRFPFNLSQKFIGGKYITGDFYEIEYPSGDVYNGVDGCKFIAQFDHVSSKVNDGNNERLFYTLIEVENIANRGKTVITKIEKSNELNFGDTKEKAEDSEGIISDYLDGFMWNKKFSKTHYEKTTLFNREDWVKKALIMRWTNEGILHIRTSLDGYDADTGKITYQVDYAGTIAQIGEATVPAALAGRFGFPSAPAFVKENQIVSKFDNTVFYHGLSPLSPEANLPEENQPIFLSTKQWMTYDGADIVGLYNEYDAAEAKIENASYRVVYAREAPVIITGKAYEGFRPEEDKDIVIETEDILYASCPGVQQNPMPVLLGKIKNPMGYGAQQNDLVTVQRVNRNTIVDDANYYYIVIGTSAPPQEITGP